MTKFHSRQGGLHWPADAPALLTAFTGRPGELALIRAQTRKPKEEPIMLKHHKRLLATAGAVVAAGTIAVTGLTAASAAPAASSTEHFQVMSTNAASNKASVIAYGVFTAAGTAYLGSGKTGKAVFPDGTITLSHKAGKGKEHFNPKTCLAMISQPGTYTIVRGTGSYSGISGSGKYLLNILFVGTKNAKGKCQGPPHGTEHELLQLAGPVHL